MISLKSKFKKLMAISGGVIEDFQSGKSLAAGAFASLLAIGAGLVVNDTSLLMSWPELFTVFTGGAAVIHSMLPSSKTSQAIDKYNQEENKKQDLADKQTEYQFGM
jgi:hypothetical protein